MGSRNDISAAGSNRQTGFDLGIYDLWRIVIEFRVMIVVLIVLPTLLAIIAALAIDPVYRSQVLLAPAHRAGTQNGLSSLGGDLGSLAAMVGISNPAGSMTDEAIAIIKSRGFTRGFIESENLIPILFSDDWDAQRAAWKVDEDDIPSFEDAYELFDKDIRSIKVDSRTELVTLSIEWTNRTEAARWAGMIVDRLNKQIRERDIEQAQEALKFLNAELSKASVIELRQGLFNLIERQIETIMLANIQEDYVFRILDMPSVADADKFVWPKRRLITLGGLMLGIFLAICAVFVRTAWRRSKKLSSIESL